MAFVNYMQPANVAQMFWVASAAYALGCLTCGYYLVRARTGTDLRRLGSGSVGARNAGRVLGAGGFLLTFFGDVGKGAAAVFITQHIAGDRQMAAVALLAVTTGHIWPVQLGFKGGKGVATALGGLAAFDLSLFFLFCCLFGVGLALLRRIIPSGMLAFLGLPLVALLLQFRASNPMDVVGTVTTAVLGFLVILAHRKNLAQEFFRFPHSDSLESSPKTKI
jgi:acyl phosphate:glycerol-3-phosphate acyltransferase